jgi:hypothetical protein
MPGNTNTIPQGHPYDPTTDPDHMNGDPNKGGFYDPGLNKNPHFMVPAQGAPGDQTGGKMTPEQGATYGDIYNQAEGMSGYFSGLAANYNQQAPTIADQSQLTHMSDYYENELNGNGPSVAENQLKSATDQSIAANMAVANSARGGAASRAGAQRTAQQGVGAQTAAAANQSAQLRAQEQQAAAAGLTQVGGLELQRGTQNAQLEQANQQQINQMQVALYGMGEQEQGLGLSSQQAYMANLLAAEGINTQQSQFNTQLGVNIGSAVAQGTAGVIGAAASDARLKTDTQPEGGTSLAASMGGSVPSVPAITTPNIQSPSSLSSLYAHPLNTSPQQHDQDNSAQVGVGAGIGGASGALAGGVAAGPVGALVGGAGGALSGGLGAAAQSRPHDDGMKAASTATSAATGAAMGAAAGTAVYPGVGTAIGGIVGGVAGLVKGLVSNNVITSDEHLKYDIEPSGLSSIDWEAA